MRLRVVLAVFLALTVLAGVGIWRAIDSLSNGLPLSIPREECVVNATGKTSLEPEQMANAATIAAVGVRKGLPDHAVTIALATALQESKLRNLQGGDRDSLGLFQQRPSQDWGKPEQIMDPRYAARRFYEVLAKVRGWQEMTVADAAQAVQRSADGSLYARWEDKARILAIALTGEAAGAVGCAVTSPPSQRGSVAISALVEGVAADWGDGHTVAKTNAVEVPVEDARSGWQYANWLVSYSAFQGIERVRYGDQVWTSKDSSWSKARTPATDRVIAEVFH